MFERHQGGEKALLVHMNIDGVEADVNEFNELALSSGVDVIEIVQGICKAPKAKYFIGTGKAEEIRQRVLLHCIDVVIVNHDLSPSQERNLEKLIQCRVLSRAGLILAIFAQRARTFEGKLQVELAQLQHMQTRLIRGWTHLERQKGGIGLRGPGETQLETDRRLLKERIKTINARLLKVRSQREENRRARDKSHLPTISLVGYTNAGKSTLFNRLTSEESLVEDKLFATLDPLMRKISLPNQAGAILADTVGFIQDLPHQLIDAFKSTLEETKGADLLLHVVDASSKHLQKHIDVVNAVLKEIGAEKVPVIMVHNKIDLVPILSSGYQKLDGLKTVWISAKEEDGLECLLKVISDCCYGAIQQYSLCLQPKHGKIRALLYEKDAVIKESIDEQGHLELLVRLSKQDHQHIQGLLLRTS